MLKSAAKVSTVYLSSCGVRVAITGPWQLLSRIIADDFIFRFIPDVTIINNPCTSMPSDVLLSLSEEFSYRYSEYKFTVTCSDNLEHIHDIIALAGYLLERKRQERRLYSIHGSLIATGDTAIALVGDISGIGKTTLAHYMSGKGYSYISDEKFIINSSNEIKGVISQTTIDHKLIKSLKYQNLRPLKPKRIYLPIKLSLILFAISVSRGGLRFFRYQNDKLVWHLYEEFTRDIRLVTGLMNGYSLPLPSLDTQDLSMQRIKDVRKIATVVPAYFISGESKDIYRSIERLMKSSAK